MNEQQFTCQLMHWNSVHNRREMPWKGLKDPYRIWLSEIILQQTRVEQGWDYYERFAEKYPTIKHLAAANDDEVFKLWEGLGYYNRCKNLLYTARFIATNSNGEFPSKYAAILSLKGVGPYTAAAIASFAFDLPYAVVDGNVLRVLSRIFGIDKAIDTTEGKKYFSDLAQKLLHIKKPALYNQAIMDFGATVCLPSSPACKNCPIQSICYAFNNGKINQLPVKEKVLKKKDRWFNYFVFTAEDKILINKRTGKDIWQNLFEFYLIETNAKLNWSNPTIKKIMLNEFGISDFELLEVTDSLKQELTHQKIHIRFVQVLLNEIPQVLLNYEWIKRDDMQRLAFPKLLNQFVKTKFFSDVLF
ncbi:MAG: A/G-specific adenine glycosylase [Ilyomonas sp.]